MLWGETPLQSVLLEFVLSLRYAAASQAGTGFAATAVSV
ncbi:hypothetical protein SBA1_500035 [Candidatus Sulfotelmatobacter kueseliae]|uniref:Uncharacterized protein n=1 Tax=Candidatus Sulfotelmatobacter kueseliae TaxID=2042962 RepID=A0A2U3KW31_9BACT|nr:hypothetical protein SBA1_500035 [Candidatus Sulfotelmatobacter kueseliae]